MPPRLFLLFHGMKGHCGAKLHMQLVHMLIWTISRFSSYMTPTSGHLQYLRVCFPELESVSTRQHVGSGRRVAKQNRELSSQRGISQKPSIITSRFSIFSSLCRGTLPSGHSS